MAVTAGFLVRVDDPAYAVLGTERFAGVRYTTYVFVVFALLCAAILGRTTLGRAIYASGGNAEAARLSGIRVGVVRATTFVLSGIGAGLAGVMISSRVATGQADTGIGIELTAIAAVVIGGTSILGGQGAVWRSVLGVLLLLRHMQRCQALITMCAWSKTVEHEGEWLSFEDYLQKRFGFNISHGISPEEAAKFTQTLATRRKHAA